MCCVHALLQEKEKLYVELKGILARQPGPEVAEQLSIYQVGHSRHVLFFVCFITEQHLLIASSRSGCDLHASIATAAKLCDLELHVTLGCAACCTFGGLSTVALLAAES
jgi:hypothetical protein